MRTAHGHSALTAGLGIGIAATAAGFFLATPSVALAGTCSRCDLDAHDPGSPEDMCKWNGDYGGTGCYGSCNRVGDKVICSCNVSGDCDMGGGGS